MQGCDLLVMMQKVNAPKPQAIGPASARGSSEADSTTKYHGGTTRTWIFLENMLSARLFTVGPFNYVSLTGMFYHLDSFVSEQL